jgi:hypothetical protein
MSVLSRITTMIGVKFHPEAAADTAVRRASGLPNLSSCESHRHVLQLEYDRRT